VGSDAVGFGNCAAYAEFNVPLDIVYPEEVFVAVLGATKRGCVSSTETEAAIETAEALVDSPLAKDEDSSLSEEVYVVDWLPDDS
jgi:hypothetical protein